MAMEPDTGVLQQYFDSLLRGSVAPLRGSVARGRCRRKADHCPVFFERKWLMFQKLVDADDLYQKRLAHKSIRAPPF